MSAATIEILLVEDNKDDAALTVRALARARLRNQVHVATTGTEALAFLGHLPPYEAAPRPDLILLDLDLPGVDGQTVLERIKGDEQLRAVPVIVVSGSLNPADVQRAYRLHANAYVGKPIEPKAFLDAVSSIEEFWLQVVTLP
jgi:CheY-like chemotaxis protein